MAESQSGLMVRSGQEFVKIGVAARLMGCSVQTLRLYERKGLIHSYRTCNGYGQRRYLLGELKKQVLGVEETEVVKEKQHVAVYVRVSSQAQAESGNRQLERMLQVAHERENIPKSEIRVFKDTASSFGMREGLNALIDGMIDGSVKKVFAEHADRVTRIPGMLTLVNHIAKRHGTEIIILDREENIDEMKLAMLELVDFVTIIANRTNARKQAARSKKLIPAETMDFIRKEVASGRAIRDTVKLANKLGHRKTKGDILSYRLVQKRLYSSKTLLKVLPVEAENSFEKFAKENLREKVDSRVQATHVYEIYCQWCSTKAILPLTNRKTWDWLSNKYSRAVTRGS